MSFCSYNKKYIDSSILEIIGTSPLSLTHLPLPARRPRTQAIYSHVALWLIKSNITIIMRQITRVSFHLVYASHAS